MLNILYRYLVHNVNKETSVSISIETIFINIYLFKQTYKILGYMFALPLYGDIFFLIQIRSEIGKLLFFPIELRLFTLKDKKILRQLKSVLGKLGPLMKTY